MPVVVTLVDDSVEELDETFGIQLSNPGGTPLPTIDVASATMTIQDGDAVTPVFGVSAAAASIAENSGSMTFTVTRTLSTLRTDSVDLRGPAGNGRRRLGLRRRIRHLGLRAGRDLQDRVDRRRRRRRGRG